MEHIDLTDKKILYELDYNARIPISILAKKLRIGRDTLVYRIKRMHDKGIITSSSVIINPYKLGLTIYKTYLRIDNNKERRENLILTLQNHPKVYWLAECDGRWDIIFSTFAKNPQEFDIIQNEILSNFSESIVEFEVYTLTEVWFYRRNYLLKKEGDYFSLGGEPGHEKIDKVDYKILKVLSQNARVNVVDISEKIKSTPMIVRHRIKKLEKRRIIQGYRINLNLSKIGMTLFKAQIYLKNYRKEIQERFRRHCSKNPHISQFIRQVGNCKLELEVEVEGYFQFNIIMKEIRENFSDLIHHIDPLLISREYFKWVPQDAFE